MGLSGNTPRYNEWTLVRKITVAGFSADTDWQSTQGEMVDGGGDPVAAFSIPSLPGRTGVGFAVQAVGVDADGAVVAPGAGSVTFDVLEVTRFSDEYNDRAVHISDVESGTPLSALSIVLPANFVARVPDAGGAQNQFTLRVSAMTGSAGATEMRLLIKPL
jgi:hypothetical protein